jgi:hypothetical protein
MLKRISNFPLKEEANMVAFDPLEMLFASAAVSLAPYEAMAAWEKLRVSMWRVEDR